MTTDLEQRLTDKPDPPAMPSSEPSKANVFFRTPHGDGHIQIVAGEHPAIIGKLVKNVQVVLKWCADSGFESRPVAGISPNGTAQKKASGGGSAKIAMTCGSCGNRQVYDNSAERANGSKRPQYKCVSCKAVDWIGNGEWKQ